MADNQTTAAEPTNGRVTRVQGSVIDVEFPVGHLPDIYNALKVTIVNTSAKEEGEAKETEITLEVEQHLGDSTVRCVALKPTDGLVRGASVSDTGAPISVPVGDVTKGHVFDVSGNILNKKPDETITVSERWPIHRNPPAFDQLESKTQMFETGIKVIDLLTPYVQGGMGRGGQFGLHAGVGQLYGVVSGSRCFLVFGEVAAISVPGTGACSGNRHHQDVSQVHTPCSIQVCLGKSPYQGVGVHIFRTISPADSSGYGACLDHAERTAGTGKGMSVVCCSDERVNILRVVSFACLLLCCGTAEERACQYKCAKDRIGFLHRFAINKYFA